MSRSDFMRFLMIFGPVFFLLLAGAWMALRSGVKSRGIGESLRLMARNASQTAALVAVCIVALMILQQAAGFRLPLAW